MTTDRSSNRRRGRAHIIVLPVAAVALAHCAVGPDFKKPAAPPVDRYSREPMPDETMGSMIPGGEPQSFVRDLDVGGQWWTLFQSPALNTIVERALKDNPSLEVAQANLRQAKEQYYAGEGLLFPTITANASTTFEKISAASFGVSTANPIFALNAASVNVSYLLDVWGGTRRQIESLKAQSNYEQFQLEATYLTLTSNIVAAAVQEASLRAQIAALQDIIAVETQELTALQRQFTVGAIANTAVLAQTAALAQSQAQLPPLQKQLSQTRNQLTALLGHYPSEEPAETFDLSSMHLPDTLPVSLPSKLVEQRPDIRAAEAQMHEASAQIGVATANLLPQITLSGAYGSQSTAALFSAGSGIWSVAAGLTQPLFEGGKLIHQRRAAVAAFDAASSQYRNVVVTAFQNVADVLRALQSDAIAVDAQERAERAALDSLDATRRQFAIGAIAYLSLLNAEQTYQQTHISLVQALATRFSDTAALFQALGGGWWNREDIADAGSKPMQ